MNRKKLITCLMVACLALSACSSNTEDKQTSTKENSASKTVVESKVETESKPETETTSSEKSTENVLTTESQTEFESELPPSEQMPSSELDMNNNSEAKTTITSGTYELGDISVTYFNSVKNDATGRWRLSIVDTDKDITGYALDYYNTFFHSDDEIHAIINSKQNTTTCISMVFGILDIRILEHIENEEQDAKLLFSGSLLKEYQLTISTGELEQIQQPIHTKETSIYE